jgi:hypothetical protein
MLTAILAAMAGVVVVAMVMVAVLKREPRRARAGHATAHGGDASWMFVPADAPAADNGDCGSGDGGGSCGGDGGGGD